jgi:hypothetical protein
MSNIVIPTLKFQLNTGDRVALKADNGLYWTRDAAHENWITASASTPGATSQFVVHVSENSQLSLEADDGRFAALLTVGDFQVIAAVERSVDQYSRFTVTVFDDATIALRADNGLYLSRYTYQEVETIAAVKTSIDQYCHFEIAELE